MYTEPIKMLHAKINFTFDCLLTDFSVDLLISMKQIYTTEDAKQLSISQRKCVFPSEIILDYFEAEYTFTSCMIECRIKNCLKYCDCIPPFYRPLRTLRTFSSNFLIFIIHWIVMFKSSYFYLSLRNVEIL